MFALLNRYLLDARTLSKLCETAEDRVRSHGRAKPASEHFVLAALELPDGTALETFRLLSITKSGFIAALEAQRTSALAAVGVAVTPQQTASSLPELLPPKSKLYEAAPSGQSLVQRLTDARRGRKGRQLLSADVLMAVAQEAGSSASRAFHELGINSAKLAAAASAATMSSATVASDASQETPDN